MYSRKKFFKFEEKVSKISSISTFIFLVPEYRRKEFLMKITSNFLLAETRWKIGQVWQWKKGWYISARNIRKNKFLSPSSDDYTWDMGLDGKKLSVKSFFHNSQRIIMKNSWTWFWILCLRQKMKMSRYFSWMKSRLLNALFWQKHGVREVFILLLTKIRSMQVFGPQLPLCLQKWVSCISLLKRKLQILLDFFLIYKNSAKKWEDNHFTFSWTNWPSTKLIKLMMSTKNTKSPLFSTLRQVQSSIPSKQFLPMSKPISEERD